MEGALESQTDFGSQALRFALVTRERSLCLSASFDDNVIIVNAPKAAVVHWARSEEEVGLYGEQPTSKGGLLTIAGIKDFRCLDRSRADSDEADPYPHPLIKSRSL